jgi:hypothetical protein
MTERTSNYLIFAFYIVTSLFFGILAYRHFLPNFINVINKTDWNLVLKLYLGLLLWCIYFWVLRITMKDYSSEVGFQSERRPSVYFSVLTTWVYCFSFSLAMYFILGDYFKDNLEYSVVTFLISVPYVTYKIVFGYGLYNNK